MSTPLFSGILALAKDAQNCTVEWSYVDAEGYPSAPVSLDRQLAKSGKTAANGWLAPRDGVSFDVNAEDISRKTFIAIKLQPTIFLSRLVDTNVVVRECASAASSLPVLSVRGKSTANAPEGTFNNAVLRGATTNGPISFSYGFTRDLTGKTLDSSLPSGDVAPGAVINLPAVTGSAYLVILRAGTKQPVLIIDRLAGVTASISTNNASDGVVLGLVSGSDVVPAPNGGQQQGAGQQNTSPQYRQQGAAYSMGAGQQNAIPQYGQQGAAYSMGAGQQNAVQQMFPPSPTIPQPTPSPWSNRRMLGVFFIVALLLFLGWLYYRKKPETPTLEEIAGPHSPTWQFGGER